MSRLGQAARLRAHARPIEDHLRRTLRLARDSVDLAHLIENVAHSASPPPWRYSSSYGSHTRESYDELPYGSLSMLIGAHEDMLRDVESWTSATDDRLLEETSEQIPDLGAMAWKLERMERGQDTGTRHLTFDLDPLSIRLLAMIDPECDGSEATDGAVGIRHMYLEDVIGFDGREANKRARRTLQAIIDTRGDSFLTVQSYVPDQSDIPGLSSVTITVLNGSVRCKANLSHAGVDSIESDAVQIQAEVSEAMTSACTGEAIEKLVDHPLLDGLGLRIEQIGPRRSGEGGSCIRIDGWRRANLTAFVVNT